MVARAKPIKDDGRYRLVKRVGRFMARVTPIRKKTMNASTQLAPVPVSEKEREVESETYSEVVIKMEPISRRKVRVHIANRKRLQPQFVYEGVDEELAVG